MRKMIFMILGSLYILGTSLLSNQNIQLPRPSGKYPVGVQYMLFEDENRPEMFTENPEDRRELTVCVWYPAENNEGSGAAPYIQNAEEIVQLFHLSSSYLDAGTNSKQNAPLSREKGPFPVLIFNHGWGEYFSQNTILMEELASHGYVVFSVAHHFECKFSFYPDGETFLFDENNPRIQKILSEQRSPDTIRIFENMFSAGTDAERERVFQAATELLPVFFTESPRMWVRDISFLIDQLILMNNEDKKFSGKLDLHKIGVFGMSMGGIAAQQICFTDGRCRAGISMDGGFYGDSLGKVLPRPFMYINSFRYTGYEQIFLKGLEGEGYVLTLPEADHYNFHDVSFIDPNHPMLGEIDGQRMMKILNEFILAFFNRFLKDADSGNLDSLKDKYPEVNIYFKMPEK